MIAGIRAWLKQLGGSAVCDPAEARYRAPLRHAAGHATAARAVPATVRPLISTAQQLQEFLPPFAAAERVAFDTEADSLHVYREKLCLIQISLPGDIHGLVDPLAGFSLDPLFTAVRGKTIVLHGADYDLRLLRRAGGFAADAIFDTMIGARLIGRREFSYAALVKAYFGIELTKGSQKANWARRPLTETMAAYAQNDTRYLLEIAGHLEAKLRELGRWAWFEQSCGRALAQAAVERERDGDELWRISGSGALRGRAAAVLREIWQWREDEARAVDRPTFHILRNEELLSASRAFAAGETPQFAHLHGGRRNRFYDAARRAMEMPESQWPIWTKRFGTRWTAQEEKRVEALKAERDRAANALDIDPSIIAARATLEALATRPDSAADLLLPWQRELIGV